MSTIVTRAGKGSPLTHAEVDANFTNLNTDKMEVGAAFNAAVAATPAVTANTAKVTNATHTGDVTGATALTIANDAVTNAKLANVATATIKGRATAGTGDPEDLTGTQATTLLDTFTSGAKGLVPASGGGTTNFLRADGTWTAPGGGGGSSLITGVPTSDQADFNPAGFGSSVGTILLQPTTNSFLTGLDAGAADQEVLLINDSTFVIFIEGEGAPSTATNRFRSLSRSMWLLPQESMRFRYSGTLSRWCLVNDSRQIGDVNPFTQMFLPGVTTTVLGLGRGSITITATIGTTIATGGPTDEFQEFGYFSGTNSTASGTSSARSNILLYLRGSVADRQGFFHTGRVRFTAMGSTSGAVRAGMMSSTAVSTVLGASMTQCLLLGADTSMTNLRIFHGGASAGTPVDLGANFPVPSASASYEYCFYAPPNSAFVRYMVRRMDSRFVAEGSLTSDIPGQTNGLGQRVEAMVGATAAANTFQCAYLMTQGL